MDDVPRLQPVTFGDLGLAGRAAMQGSALGEQFGPGGAMDGAVDATAAQQDSLAR
jgi:hypothetical protein